MNDRQKIDGKTETGDAQEKKRWPSVGLEWGLAGAAWLANFSPLPNILDDLGHHWLTIGIWGIAIVLSIHATGRSLSKAIPKYDRWVKIAAWILTVLAVALFSKWMYLESRPKPIPRPELKVAVKAEGFTIFMTNKFFIAENWAVMRGAVYVPVPFEKTNVSLQIFLRNDSDVPVNNTEVHVYFPDGWKLADQANAWAPYDESDKKKRLSIRVPDSDSPILPRTDYGLPEIRVEVAGFSNLESGLFQITVRSAPPVPITSVCAELGFVRVPANSRYREQLTNVSVFSFNNPTGEVHIQDLIVLQNQKPE